jgi:hypothetical protein
MLYQVERAPFRSDVGVGYRRPLIIDKTATIISPRLVAVFALENSNMGTVSAFADISFGRHISPYL